MFIKDNIGILVSNRRYVGTVIAPYFLNRTSPTTFEIEGVVTSLMIEGQEGVSPELSEIVAIAERISEQRIAKSFSRNKTAKAFYDALTDEMVKNTIRPYIDKQICAMLPHIVSAGMPVYLRDEKYKEINTADRVEVAPLFKCRPRFFFTLPDSGDLLYTLKVSDGLTEVSLFNADVRELSVSPAVIIVDKKLYSFADIESKKFMPFANRPRIRVEAKMVDSYMSKFVLNCVRRYRVAAYGFIIEKVRKSFVPVLRAVRTISGCVFELYFDYGGVLSNSSDSEKHVELIQTPQSGYHFCVTLRNHQEEQKVVEDLVRDLGLIPCNGQFQIEAKADFQSLAVWANDRRDYLRSRNVSVELTDETEQYFYGDWAMHTSYDKTDDWFDLKITVDVGDFHIPFRKFFDNILSGDNRYVLPDGQVFILPDEWFEEWTTLLPFVDKYASDDNIRLEAPYFRLLPSYVSGDAEPDEAVMAEVGNVEMHGHLNATLRDYQQKGVLWMLRLAACGRGGILADDMGLGKTIQTAALLSSHFSAGENAAMPNMLQFNSTGIAPALIVMPVSLLFNWRAELQKFVPHLSVYTLMGKQAGTNKSLSVVLARYHIVLTTYAQVRLYVDNFSQMVFSYLILDESHVAKNPSSKTYAALASLRAEHRINLSGTPVENNLLDLWAQMNLVNPGLLGSRNSFEQFFRTPIEHYSDPDRISRLKLLTRPFILRRTKAQVLNELPPITIQTVSCVMSDEQREVYEREKSACRNMLLDGSVNAASKRFMTLQALTRLRLIANHPSLCITDYEGGSGKTEVVMEHIRSIADSGHKMLVFSSFVRDLDMLASHLSTLGIGYEMLTGSTHDREAVINRFATSPQKSVFLISLKAGGVGLNLTCADYVLILNPWWNPAAEAQAYNRVHRMGQENNVTVYRFISAETIEEKIDRMQERKRKLANDVVNEEAAIASPSDDELEKLLMEE